MRLIQFAFDPVWRTDRPVIENLGRVQRIGDEAWLGEQAAYWLDGRRLERWLQLHKQCKADYARMYEN
jgi:hypothetical protein